MYADQDDTDIGSQASSDASSSFSGPTGDAAAKGISGEELTRLRDELLALRLHHQDLLGEEQALQAALAERGVASDGSQLPQLHGKLSASWRNLSTNMKKASGTTFSARVSSLQTAFQQNAANLKRGAGPPQMAAQPLPPGVEGAFAADEREALLVEADQMRSRIRATTEEIAEFQAVARDARAAASERAHVRPTLGNLSRARCLPVGELRDLMFACLGEAGRAELSALDDGSLADVMEALVPREDAGAPDGGCDAECSTPPVTAAAEAGAEHATCSEKDEYQVLLQGKIAAQEEEHDRLLQVYIKQEEQMFRLRNQLPDAKGRRAEDGKGRDARKLVRDKLDKTESQVQGLLKQVESSEEASRQSRDLRAQLKSMVELKLGRDKLLDELRAHAAEEEKERDLLRERLNMVVEDLCGHRWRRPAPRRVSIPHAGHDPEPARPPPPPSAPAVSSTAPARHGSPSRARTTPVAEVGCQADLAPGLAAVRERQQLQTELEDVRVEKALLEKRAGQELRELRALARDEERRRAEGAEAAAVGAVVAAAATTAPASEAAAPGAAAETSSAKAGAADASAPCAEVQPVPAAVLAHGAQTPELPVGGAHEREVLDEEEDALEPYPAGLVYVQRVAELEQATDALRQHLQQLHQSEQMLRAQNKEKAELIAHLMRKAKITDLRDLDFGDGGLDAWRAQRGEDPEADAEDLTRIIEETTQDNIRLRNDIRIMSDELRKVLTSPGGTAALGGGASSSSRPEVSASRPEAT